MGIGCSIHSTRQARHGETRLIRDGRESLSSDSACEYMHELITIFVATFAICLPSVPRLRGPARRRNPRSHSSPPVTWANCFPRCRVEEDRLACFCRCFDLFVLVLPNLRIPVLVHLALEAKGSMISQHRGFITDHDLRRCPSGTLPCHLT